MTTARRVLGVVAGLEALLVAWLALGVYLTPTTDQPTDAGTALVVAAVAAPLVWFAVAAPRGPRASRTAEWALVAGSNAALVALSWSGSLGLDTSHGGLANALVTLTAVVVSTIAGVVLLGSVERGARSAV